MKMVCRFALSALACLLAGCTWCGQQLQSESGLYDVQLKHYFKVSVDGFYIAEQAGRVALPDSGSICVTPMSVEQVQDGDGADYLPSMQRHMDSYLRTELSSALKEFYPAGEWTVTDDAELATVRVDTALVRFRPQRPFLRVASTLAGPFIRVPLVADGVQKFAEGGICIEGTVRLCSDNSLLYAFKDSNRETAALYMREAYQGDGNAELSLRIWAKKLARLIYASAYARRNGDDIRRLIDERSLTNTIEAYRE